MKLAIVPVLFGLLAWGEADHFRRLALQPGTRVVWSKEAGRLAGGDSIAVVTALVLEDPAQPGQPGRGARIEFSQGKWKAAVYLEAGQLASEKRIFDQLARDVELMRPSPGRGLGFVGSCEFRDQSDRYPLQADFEVSGPDAPALRVAGPELERQLMFNGVTPAELAKVLGRAVDALSGH